MCSCRRTSITPRCKLDIDRVRASELGLSEKEVVGNVITALTSNGMIAPSYWVDPKSGNDYLLTVQYPENQIQNLADLRAIPLRGAHSQRADAARRGQHHHAHQVAHRGGSLPAAPRDRCLRVARGRGPRRAC